MRSSLAFRESNDMVIDGHLSELFIKGRESEGGCKMKKLFPIAAMAVAVSVSAADVETFKDA